MSAAAADAGNHALVVTGNGQPGDGNAAATVYNPGGQDRFAIDVLAGRSDLMDVSLQSAELASLTVTGLSLLGRTEISHSAANEYALSVVTASPAGANQGALKVRSLSQQPVVLHSMPAGLQSCRIHCMA